MRHMAASIVIDSYVAIGILQSYEQPERSDR